MFTRLLGITAVFIALSKSQDKQYVATFTEANNGIEGTVTVDNGTVIVDIDLTMVDNMTFPGGFDSCTDGGMSYHIHQKWTYTNDNNDKVAGGCDGTYTGSHIDPWAACGGASGNEYCEPTTGATANQCIPKADYSTDFPANFSSAEIGDWSGKYGKLILDENDKLVRTDSSFYEVLPKEVNGLAVVFHCNSGARAFCAPFLESSTVTSVSVPTQSDTGKAVAAKFTALSDGSKIVLYPNGNVTVEMDAKGAYESMDIEATLGEGCESLEYSIFEMGNTALDSDALGEECEGKIGAQYDPTNQCLPWSASKFCNRDATTAGKLCGDTQYGYNCDWSNDRFSCAPGDLSGKFGMFENPGTEMFQKDIIGADTLIPPTNDLIGKVIAITCPKTSDTMKVLACAKIEEYVWDDDDDESAAGKIAAITFFVVIAAVFKAIM